MKNIRWERLVSYGTIMDDYFNLKYFDEIITAVFLNCNNTWTVSNRYKENEVFKTRKEAFEYAEEINIGLIHETLGLDFHINRPRNRHK